MLKRAVAGINVSWAVRAGMGDRSTSGSSGAGRLILQLHRWDVEHQHGPIGDPNLRPYGNGVLLWFELDDFDAAVARADEMKADIIKPRHRSENAHWECWLRDPEGYTLVLASPHGSAA